MKILKNIEKFSSTLAENKSLLTSLAGDEKATDSFINAINKLPRLINNFSKVGSNVNEDLLPLLKEFIKELNIIAKDIDSKLKSLDSVIDSVSSSDKDIIKIKESTEIIR